MHLCDNWGRRINGATTKSKSYFFIILDGHSVFRHSEHFGLVGVHMVCPKPTSWVLTSVQYSNGNHFSSSTRVCSGSLVGFGTHFKRFDMRWTWTSTPIPVTIFQAEFMQICAIFGPTPGNFNNPSRVFGMSDECSSMRIWDAFWMFLVLVCGICISSN